MRTVPLALALAALSSGGCVRSPTARAEGWWSARTAHIALESDAGRDAAARAARDLEELHAALSLAFYHCGHGAEGDVVSVTVLSRDDEFDEIAPESSGVAIAGVDGLVVLPPRIVLDGFAVSDVGARQVFAHELTHAFVRACFPDAPAWLHEGLATVFETVHVRGESVVAGEAAYEISDRMYADLDWVDGRPVPVIPRARVPEPSALVRFSWSDFHLPPQTGARTSTQARTGNYAAAWALVHMLALGPDQVLRDRFRRYLGVLSSGTGRSVLFASAFADLDLDRRFDAYLRTGHFATFRRPWSGQGADPPQVAPVSSPDAHLRLASLILQTRGARAYPVVEPHLDAADLDPSTRARSLLLRAAFLPEQASALITEAAALAPDDRDVLRAHVLVTRRTDYPAAIALASTLATRTDLRGADLAVIAHVELHAGRYEDAFGHASAAVEAEPRAWWAWLELGRAAFHVGHMQQAHDAMRRVATSMAHGSPAIAARALRWLRRIEAASGPPPGSSGAEITQSQPPP